MKLKFKVGNRILFLANTKHTGTVIDILPFSLCVKVRWDNSLISSYHPDSLSLLESADEIFKELLVT